MRISMKPSRKKAPPPPFGRDRSRPITGVTSVPPDFGLPREPEERDFPPRFEIDDHPQTPEPKPTPPKPVKKPPKPKKPE